MPELVLTKELLKVMRGARSLCLSWVRDSSVPYSEALHRGHKLRIITQITESLETECEVEIGGSVLDYADRETERQQHGRAFCHLSTYSEQVDTALQLAKPGDTLSLIWRADNNNQYEIAAGLHHDEVCFVLKRKGNRLVFNVHSSVCPNNYGRTFRTS